MSSVLYANVPTDFTMILPNADTALLASIVDQVSRNIEAACGRVFYLTPETRYFDLNKDRFIYYDYSMPQFMLPPDKCPIDDFVPDDTTVVKVDGIQLTSDQYEFHPLNSPTKSQIKINNGFGKRIEITGNWGYSETVPAAISNACIFLSRLTYQATMERQLKSDRTGNYSAVYADTELYPTPELYSQLLRSYQKVGII